MNLERQALRDRLDAAVVALNPAVCRALAVGTVPAARVLVVVEGDHPAASSLAGASGRRLPDGSACGLVGHGAARELATKLSPDLATMLDRSLDAMQSHALVIGQGVSLAMIVRWVDVRNVGAQA